MLTIPRDHTTVDRLQELLDAVFKARDQLYAAADSLADADESYICRRFGDRLGGNAADLQQIITASGVRPLPHPRNTMSGRCLRRSSHKQATVVSWTLSSESNKF